MTTRYVGVSNEGLESIKSFIWAAIGGTKLCWLKWSTNKSLRRVPDVDEWLTILRMRMKSVAKILSTN